MAYRITGIIREWNCVEERSPAMTRAGGDETDPDSCGVLICPRGHHRYDYRLTRRDDHGRCPAEFQNKWLTGIVTLA